MEEVLHGKNIAPVRYCIRIELLQCGRQEESEPRDGWSFTSTSMVLFHPFGVALREVIATGSRSISMCICRSAMGPNPCMISLSSVFGLSRRIQSLILEDTGMPIPANVREF